MLSLSDLTTSVLTSTVTLRGVACPATVPTALQMAELRKVRPRPVPPAQARPGPAGGALEWGPDETEPGYVRAHREWLSDMAVLELAVAIDWQTAGLLRYDNALTLATWATDAIREISGVLTDAEIRSALDTIYAPLKAFDAVKN